MHAVTAVQNVTEDHVVRWMKGDRPRIDFLGESFQEVASLIVAISSRRG